MDATFGGARGGRRLSRFAVYARAASLCRSAAYGPPTLMLRHGIHPRIEWAGLVVVMRDVAQSTWRGGERL